MVGAKLEHQNERILAQRRIWDIVAGSAFTAVFQPIVDLDSGRVAGYEALTRFHDGTSPEERFAEARAVGLDLILERACLQAALAESAGLPPEAWVSLNVTPEYLIRRSGRNPLGRRDRPSRIVLEIAEQSAIEDYGRLRESLSSLRQEGVAIAVDDAGVGFDTLRRLLELRPEFIKLDRSLIRGLARDGVRQALVSAIVQFAQQAGASLIAEGVERPEERDALHRLGVRYGQGFLLGAPVPAGLDAGRGRHRVRHGRTPPTLVAAWAEMALAPADGRASGGWRPARAEQGAGGSPIAGPESRRTLSLRPSRRPRSARYLGRQRRGTHGPWRPPVTCTSLEGRSAVVPEGTPAGTGRSTAAAAEREDVHDRRPARGGLTP